MEMELFGITGLTAMLDTGGRVQMSKIYAKKEENRKGVAKLK